MTVWVFNIWSREQLDHPRVPGEFNVTATSPGRFTCIDVDSQFIWAIYYYNADNTEGINSRNCIIDIQTGQDIGHKRIFQVFLAFIN